jgi:hypothetical protein
MASLLEQAQRNAARRGGLVRAPGGLTVRQVPRSTQQFVARPQAPVAPPQQPRSQLDQLLGAFASTPEAQQVAQKKAQEEAKANQSVWGKGLGAVFGNPLTKGLFNAVDLLSYPRRAITVGLEELTKITPEWAELGMNKMIDEDASDGRSAWDRINDKDYGFGSIIEQGSNEGGRAWLNRAIGLGGDLLLDPLTYVSGGATKLAEGGTAATRGLQAADAFQDAQRAERAVSNIGRAAEGARFLPDSQAGMVDDYLEAMQRATTAADQAEVARLAHVAAREAPGGLRVVPARANRAGRLGELGELTARNPEIIAQNEAEFARIAARGYSAAESPAVREALGLLEPALRLGGANIPGTRRAAAALERIGGSARGALNTSPLARLGRGPVGLEDAQARLLGRQGALPEGQVLQDLSTFGLSNATREGAEVKLRGNRLLTTMTKGKEGLGRMSPEARSAQVKAAETAGEETPLNAFFNAMADIYKSVSGREVRKLGDSSDTYVPHMLTPRFRRFLRTGGEDARQFMDQAGFMTEDLLEGSGYLEKARKLVPGARIEIGGQTIQIGDGTIDDLNNKLRQAFPNFTGKFYEDDPIRIGEAYVDSLAKGAGKEKALQRFADSPNPLVQRVAGELDTTRTEINETLARQDPLYDAMRSGNYDPTVPLPKAPASPLSAEERAARVADGDLDPGKFFTEVPDASETITRAQWLRSREARGVRNTAIDERDAEMARLVADVKNQRTDVANRLLEVKEATTPQVASRIYKSRIQKLERELDKIEAEIAAIKEGTAAPEVRQQLADFLAANAEQQRLIQDDLQRQLRGAASQAGKERASKLRALEGHLQTLKEQEARAYSMVADPGPMQEAVAERMRLLNEPVERARAALELATSGGFRHAEKDVAAARSIVTKADAGAPTADRTLARARKILKEEREDRLALGRAAEEPRRRLEMAEFQRARRPSLGPVPTPSRTFEAAETEEATLRAVRQEIESTSARVGTAQRATIRREQFERTMIHRQDAVRKEVRLMHEARKQQILDDIAARTNEVRTQRRLAESKARGVIKPAAERIKFLDQQIDSISAAIAHDQAEMAVVRSQEARVREIGRAIQRMSTDTRKIETVKELERKVLDPMREVAAQNPEMGDEVLNSVEVLLDDAAGRMLELSQRDLRDGDVAKLIRAAEEDKLAPVMMAVLNDQWKLMHPGNVGQGSIFVDQKLADQFNLLFELRKEPMLFGRTLNAMTNLFKTYATLSPGFHVRNALSAIFMNTSDGVALSAQKDAVGLWKQFARGGEEWLGKQRQEVRDAFTAIAASGAGGRFTESGVAETIDATARGAGAYNKLASNRVTRLSQRAGNAVESVVRLGMSLDSMRKGESVQAAIQRITRVHFDYGQVSRLDENAKRLIPFWTFMSRNLPLQVSQMWTKPRAYAQYANFVRNVASPDVPYTPEYWSDAGAWNSGAQVAHMPLYIQPDLGFTRLQSDVEDIEDALSGDNPGGLLSSMNPFITAPLEYITRTDFFTGQQFPEGEGFERQGGLLGLPITALAKLTGNADEANRVDPRFMNALNAINPLQGRAERLTPQLTGGDEEDRRRQGESIARFLGIPIRTLTQQQQDNEYLRRYYELLDERRRQRELAAS